MHKLKLKVCGMRDEVNIHLIGGIQPDYLGFIFYEKSPRYVGATCTLPASDFRGETVGVFVNESIETVIERLKAIGSGIAQLHGNETPDDCQQLRDAGIRVIKAIAVGAEYDAAAIKKYIGAADYFLFDTKGKLFGGNSTRFDWSLLEKYDQELPFFLSGGIGVDDITQVADIGNPSLYAIDINSGVEISPGLKDPQRVKLAKEIIDKL